MTLSEALEIQSLIDLELEKLRDILFSWLTKNKGDNHANLTREIRQVSNIIGNVLMVSCLREERTIDHTRV